MLRFGLPPACMASSDLNLLETHQLETTYTFCCVSCGGFFSRLQFLCSQVSISTRRFPRMKVRSLIAALLTVGMAVAACGQGRGKAEVTINGKTVTIDYGRPELKGRDMLGKATPGTIWRF